MTKSFRLVFVFFFTLVSSIGHTTDFAPPIKLKYQQDKEVSADIIRPEINDEDKYKEAILKTASMVGDARARELVQKHGLNIMNVTWEDTGRYKGSSVGPNISDMTIQVGAKNSTNGNRNTSLMPVIRYENFSDRTADVDPMAFTLLVGNEEGRRLKRISLREFLEDPTRYLSRPKEWKAGKKSLLADRDSKVLVSAQAAFLPVPQKGKAEFNPVLFNYQSYSENPAVLTILATNEGTSVTIIDNKRDTVVSGSWGQRLFHNEDGQRASLTGQRLTDHIENNSELKNTDLAKDVKKASSLNMVLLIQVPLKQKPRARYGGPFGGGLGAMADMSTEGSAPMPQSSAKSKYAEKEVSNVEAAVIGHGEFEGRFTEIDNLSIERDSQFPIRVTVQFYKATSNGVVNEADVKQIKEEIDSVLNNGTSIGSLVVEGDTGRTTEYEGLKVQPLNWWDDFWLHHYQNSGETRHLAINKLKKLMGNDYMKKEVSELLICDMLQNGTK